MSDYDNPVVRSRRTFLEDYATWREQATQGTVPYPTKLEEVPNLDEAAKLAESLNKGLKYDSDKPRMELLSTKWLNGVARVMGFGAKKYAAHNWRRGIARSRLLGAALRHVFAYLDGEDNDQESGLSHLYHASCCLMFAAEQHETHTELDDRYRGDKK